VPNGIDQHNSLLSAISALLGADGLIKLIVIGHGGHRPAIAPPIAPAF
jgi:hypothetical protein